MNWSIIFFNIVQALLAIFGLAFFVLLLKAIIKKEAGFGFAVIFLLVFLGDVIFLVYNLNFTESTSDMRGWWPLVLTLQASIDLIFAAVICIFFNIFNYYSKKYVWTLASLIFLARFILPYADSSILPYSLAIIIFNIIWCFLYGKKLTDSTKPNWG